VGVWEGWSEKEQVNRRVCGDVDGEIREDLRLKMWVIWDEWREGFLVRNKEVVLCDDFYCGRGAYDTI